MTTKPFTTISELAASLGCTSEAIYSRIKDRGLTPQRVGNAFILTPDEVERVRQPMTKGWVKGRQRGKREKPEPSGDIRASESTTETTKEQN